MDIRYLVGCHLEKILHSCSILRQCLARHIDIMQKTSLETLLTVTAQLAKLLSQTKQEFPLARYI